MGFWLLFIALALISGIADITHFRNLPEQLIGQSDQANTANVARNIVEGKGATTDAIWLLTGGGIPGSAIPQPESYWSIYVAFFVAIFFKFFGASLSTLILPAVLCKTATAALSCIIALRISKSIYSAPAIAVFLLFHPVITDRLNGQSDIYLTLCVIVALMLLISAITKQSWRKFLAYGIVCGIAIGVKPSGGLLVGLLMTYLLFSGRLSRAAPQVGLALIGLLIGIAPLVHHNYKYFDSPIGAGYALVNAAAKISFVTKDHNLGFYNPEPFEFRSANSGSENSPQSQGMRNISQFVQRLIAGDIAPAWQLPFIFLSILLVARATRTPFFLRTTSYGALFSYNTIFLLAGGTLLGYVVHFESRYWNFLIPLLAIMTVTAMGRLSRYIPLFVIATSLFSFALAQRYYIPKPVPAGLAMAQKIIPPGAVVLTPDPWEFAFHTRLKAVVLPYTSNPSVLQGIANRYSSQYLVIVNNNIRHEFYRPIIEGNLPRYLMPIYRDDNLIIAKFNWH